MNAIVCEMCGSRDLVKQDGLYVCQHCNAKYTVEEAKKLMVTIDNSSKVNNLLKIAKQAQFEKNYEKAGKYYDLVLQEDAENWEAAFYSVFDSAMCTNIAGIENAAYQIGNCFPNVLALIKSKGYNCNDEFANIIGLETDILNGFSCLYEATVNHYRQFQSVDSAPREAYIRIKAIILTLFRIGDLIEEEYAENGAIPKTIMTLMWSYGILLCKTNPVVGNRDVSCDEHIEKMKKYDPEYQEPAQPSNGCYIATAVYGSYDCPQVWTLRRFRDFSLRKTWCGRLFIKVYYAISPAVVRLFGKTEWFNSFWKKNLDKIVSDLQGKGFESTPYND